MSGMKTRFLVGLPTQAVLPNGFIHRSETTKIIYHYPLISGPKWILWTCLITSSQQMYIVYVRFHPWFLWFVSSHNGTPATDPIKSYVNKHGGGVNDLPRTHSLIRKWPTYYANYLIDIQTALIGMQLI